MDSNTPTGPCSCTEQMGSLNISHLLKLWSAPLTHCTPSHSGSSSQLAMQSPSLPANGEFESSKKLPQTAPSCFNAPGSSPWQTSCAQSSALRFVKSWCEE